MAIPMPYEFIHHYGCEPYAANNGAGGATITQQNLVITTWGGTNAEESSSVNVVVELDEIFDGATLLIPNPNNPAVSAFERVASAQAFHSRHSAHTYVQQGTDKQAPTITAPGVGYVLNPPPEFKQYMRGALVYNGGDPLLLTSWTAKKSLMSQYAWRYNIEQMFQTQGVSGVERSAPANTPDYGANAPTSQIQAIFSTYLHLPNPASGTYRVPFLKTSGADGSVPQFFDPFTVGGAREMVEAVDAGEFFVFMQLASTILGEVTSASVVMNHAIVWPHSAARG